MTSTSLSLQSGAQQAHANGGLSWWFSDVWEMTIRNIKRLLRSPEIVLYSLFQPMLFILLFTFVFGGAIKVAGDYAQFLIPGIFVQMALYNSGTGTTIAIAAEMHTGLMDRFRSMPMSRTSILIGRTLSEVFRNIVTLAVMVLVGLLVGFRFLNGLVPALGAVALPESCHGV